MDAPRELWEAIAEAPDYEVSSWGRVRRGGPDGELVHVWFTRKGYPAVTLETGSGRSCANVHRLVLEAFLDPPSPRHQADHVDGDRRRCELHNLEWVTPAENVRRARERARRYLERLTGQLNLLDFVR